MISLAIVVFAASWNLSGSSRAEDEVPLRSAKQKVVAFKESTFSYEIKNSGSQPLILSGRSGTEYDECRAFVPEEPIMPGKTATVRVVCSFHFDASESGSVRTPRVYIVGTVPGQKTRMIPLQVDAVVYRHSPAQKQAAAAREERDKTVLKSEVIEVENS